MNEKHVAEIKQERRKIADLNPAEYNPRKDLQPGDEEFERLKRSVETFGYIDPIIVNKDGTAVGGHQRLKVLQVLGYTEADCAVVDLSKEDEKALNIALNKIAGEWDEEKLVEIFAELDAEEYDLTLTGFAQDEYAELTDALASAADAIERADPDNVEGPPEMPTSKRGDIWKIGPHRLMCGDSTSVDDMEVLMDGKLADMMLTDPPYNVAYEGKTKDALKIENDSMDDDKFRAFLEDAFEAAGEHLKAGGAFYIWHADVEGYNFRGACAAKLGEVRQCLVWAKNAMTLGRQDYQWKHEPCLYGWRGGGGSLLGI